MTRTTLTLMLGLTLAGPVHPTRAGGADRPKPPAVPPEAVNALFAEWDAPDSPGCALGVVRDGTFLYRRGYGMANLEHDLPITPETVFRIGSTSKQFTAAAVALLAEQGKLSLDDEIRKYLPEMPAYEAPITVRHLVHHTSGVRDYLELMALAGLRDTDYLSETQVLALLARQRGLNFPPGTAELYSNSGYFLLSQIVRRASGHSLREFAEARIFRPLEMRHTHFHDDHTRIVKGRADGYAPGEQGGFVRSTTELDIVGDGGVFTTIDDLRKWDQNFYQNRLGKGGPALIDRLLAPGTLAGGEALDYAFGLIVGAYRGLPTVRHGGAFAGFRAELLRFPEERLSVVCLCNLSTIDPSTLTDRVADLYLAHRFPEAAPAAAPSKAAPAPPTAVAVDPAVYDTLVGQYQLQPGFLLTISREEDRIFLQATGQPQVEMFPESETRYFLKVVDAQLEFAREASGPATRLTLYQYGQVLPAPRITPVTLTAEQWAAYAGTYFSPELDVTYTLRWAEGTLSAQVRDLEPIPLTVSGEDQLGAFGSTATFERDAEGVITGFRLDTGRVQGLRFTRRGDIPSPQPPPKSG